MWLSEVEAAEPTLAGASTAAPVDPVLFRYSARSIHGSRWGPIGELQRALSAVAVDCGLPPVMDDGVFGRGTRDTLISVSTCRSWASADGAVSADTWRSLVHTDSPTARDRAVAMTLTFEATDFDRMEWNFRTRGDERSVLTWGPFGATAGWGGEVQAVLRAVDAIDPALLDRAFGPEVATARRLTASPPDDAFGLLQPVFDAEPRRRRWVDAFAALGAEPAVRSTYFEVAFRPEWLGGALDRLRSLLPGPATEVDAAFFLDLAVHTAIRPERLDAARAAISEAEATHPLTAAERRREIGEAFATPLGRWQEHRRGRNVCYTIDDLPPTAAEQAAWEAFGRLRASDVGLSDERVAGW